MDSLVWGCDDGGPGLNDSICAIVNEASGVLDEPKEDMVKAGDNNEKEPSAPSAGLNNDDIAGFVELSAISRQGPAPVRTASASSKKSQKSASSKRSHVSTTSKMSHVSATSKRSHVSVTSKKSHVSVTSKKSHVSVSSKKSHVSVTSRKSHVSASSKKSHVSASSKKSHLSTLSKKSHISTLSKKTQKLLVSSIEERATSVSSKHEGGVETVEVTPSGSNVEEPSSAPPDTISVSSMKSYSSAKSAKSQTSSKSVKSQTSCKSMKSQNSVKSMKSQSSAKTSEAGSIGSNLAQPARSHSPVIVLAVKTNEVRSTSPDISEAAAPSDTVSQEQEIDQVCSGAGSVASTKSQGSFKLKAGELGSVRADAPKPDLADLRSSSISSLKSQNSVKTSRTSSTVEDSSGSLTSTQSLGSKKMTLAQRYSLSMARNPKMHVSVAFFTSIAVTVICIAWGNIELRVGGDGLFSRGTEISNRATQKELMTERIDYGEDDSSELYCNGTYWYQSEDLYMPDSLNFNSIWKTADADLEVPKISALDANSLHELCLAEEKTLSLLEKEDLCYKCPLDESTSKCLQPFSLVALARIILGFTDGLDAKESFILAPPYSCDELQSKWSSTIQTMVTSILTECTNYMMEELEGSDPQGGQYDYICEELKTATVVDNEFLLTGVVKYTSSIYATKNDDDSVLAMYELDRAGKFPTSGQEDSQFEGVYYELTINSLYTTPELGFYEHFLNYILPWEVVLSTGALTITTGCILFHTRSPFLTLLGLMQIMFALPWAYFVYYFILRLPFFPFININAVFIVFSLGADDIFVAVDKWKIFRQKLPPDATTEEVAVAALPNTAYATFVTSITTAVAFLASAVIKVPAISLFATYCGLVVAVDYFLCIALVFPALCVYDKMLADGSLSVCPGIWWNLNIEEIKQLFNTWCTWCTCCKGERGNSQPNITTMPNEEPSGSNPSNSAVFHSGNRRWFGRCCKREGDNSPRNNSILCKEASESSPSNSAASCEGPTGDEECNILLAPTEEGQLVEMSAVKERDGGSEKGWGYRALSIYYEVLHKLRWPILLLSLAVIAVCTYLAFQFPPPDQPDPAFLPETISYEKHRVWSRELAIYSIAKDDQGEVFVLWGLIPSDTGAPLNPDDVSEIVYDTTFNPRSKENQRYLLSMCDKMFEGSGKIFRIKLSCPMEDFNSWLMEQSQSNSPDEEYTNNCQGAKSVPVPEEAFDSCMIAFSTTTDSVVMLHDDGVVNVLGLRGRSNTTFYSTYKEQRAELGVIEEWFDKEKLESPEGASNFFQISHDFWGFDTLREMRLAAWKSAAIALACASVMILLTSKSVTIMIFSAVSIAYVLAASAACFLSLGWTMGLFESILFSILIGIGCDFVLHFGHAYTHIPGVVSKEVRTRHALISMGPSVLGSAFTTLTTALIMLGATNVFSKKFAEMLAMTIVHSTIGSFVVFLSLCDCIGPNSTCLKWSKEEVSSTDFETGKDATVNKDIAASEIN
eukprot:CAMPEP_0172573132 /NCGR_PEP_ID=MMETSP1067-20121228/136035_1 /TAXON_ID=265564 ORGANISM="Thalassiosira punctigera, Strain Tpunct2005C2" /NCGR_SAMPLE_ID=MMETSP1067 /ASSEMBLY_ACC=CAM_ASM_000444 /LENGTH=1496 /DNA_ID=CAMNT_0013365729 /DNA_START=147 /DNA_END=4637 /DNA_ORIENTATION=-